MADGSLQIELTGTLADEVRAAAAASGLAPDEYVRQQLEFLAFGGDAGWDEDERRLEEPGENIPLEKAFDEFRAHVAELRNKAK